MPNQIRFSIHGLVYVRFSILKLVMLPQENGITTHIGLQPSVSLQENLKDANESVKNAGHPFQVLCLEI